MVYDVKEYLPHHPGGSDMIRPYLGKCIDEPFEEHGHTKLARGFFNELPKMGYIQIKGKSNALLYKDNYDN